MTETSLNTPERLQNRKSGKPGSNGQTGINKAKRAKSGLNETKSEEMDQTD